MGADFGQLAHVDWVEVGLIDSPYESFNSNVSTDKSAGSLLELVIELSTEVGTSSNDSRVEDDVK